MANPTDAMRHYEHIYIVIFTSFEMAVDTFLVMGSFLMTISTLDAINKKSLNIPKLILHRFLRYTPPLAALILFTVSLYKFFLDGPNTDANENIIRNCQKFWYSTIFHIQNYLNPNEICLTHTW